MTSTDAYEALIATVVAARDTEYSSKLEDKTARLNAIEAVLIELLELLIDERRVDG